MPNAVDEECRRSVHSAPHATPEILFDSREGLLGLHLLHEPLGVESERLCAFQEISIFEGVLVLEDPVVHLPELPLSGGNLRGLGGVLGVGMNAVEGKIPEDEAETLSQRLLEPLYD